MSQQQLLLLVLGVIVVGLATIVGIQTFQERAREAEFDRMMVMASLIYSDMTVWKGKPAIVGGGQDVSFFRGFRWDDLGLVARPDDIGVSDDGTGIIYYVPPFNSNTNGVPLKLHNLKWLIGIEMRFYGLTVECFQIRRMTKASRGLWWRGWEFSEPTWAEADTIPASCPATW